MYPEAKLIDLVAIGNVAVDYYLMIGGLSWGEEKSMARGTELLPGGTMGNVACAAAKLGLKARS